MAEKPRRRVYDARESIDDSDKYLGRSHIGNYTIAMICGLLSVSNIRAGAEAINSDNEEIRMRKIILDYEMYRMNIFGDGI